MKKITITPINKEALFQINIGQSKSFIPEWYKNSSLKIKGLEKYSLIPNFPSAPTSTYKKCSPFLDALTNGYMFSLAQDIEVIKKDDGSPYILWKGNKLNPITWHNNDQWEGLEYPSHCHDFVYKWENYFVINTPKNYSTLFTHPHNRFDLPFHTLSGVVDTDKYVHPVHFPFFLKKDFTGIIKAGTPVAQITFFKRNHWFRSINKYNEDNIDKNTINYLSKIDRPYKNLFWQKKEYD